MREGLEGRTYLLVLGSIDGKAGKHVDVRDLDVLEE